MDAADFCQAPPLLRQAISSDPTIAMISVDGLKARLPTAEQVAHDLYGIEFKHDLARCPFAAKHNHGDRNPSLRFDRKKNRIFCASRGCFGETGVDAIGLVQIIDGCDFKGAVERLASYYYITGTGGSNGKPKKIYPKGRQDSLADIVRRTMEKDGWRAVAEHPFGPALRKVRFEHTKLMQPGSNKPEKTYRWEHFDNNHWWQGAGGQPKSLYLNSLFQARDQLGLVIGVEGEHKADLAGELGFAAFSFKDGLSKETVAALGDCEVVLWPDKDASGGEQAQRAAKIIADSGSARSVALLEPPEDLPPSGDIVDAVRMLNWTADDLRRLFASAQPFVVPGEGDDKTAEAEKHRAPVPVSTLSAGELCKTTYPIREWLVEGILRPDDVALLVGRQKSGKSLLALQLAVSLATGADFLGHRASKPRKVLYLDFENKPPDLQDRLHKMFGDAAKDIEHLRFYCPPSMGDPGLASGMPRRAIDSPTHYLRTILT